ncbi:MAG: OmpH family outer membrane protein [Desulfopila sp.]
MFLKTCKSMVVCLFVGMVACWTASAADSDELKIGIMNVQKVLVQSNAGLEAKEKFEKRKNELEASFAADQQALQELKDTIDKKSSVWSEEKKEGKILEFNKMRRDLETKSKDGQMEMKNLQDKELEPIIKELEQVVNTFGDEQSYSMILDSKNGVVFYDKAHDISDALIEELNKAMK